MVAGRKDMVPIDWIITPHPYAGNKTWTGNGADNEVSRSTPVVAPTQHQAREGKQEKASPSSQGPWVYWQLDPISLVEFSLPLTHSSFVSLTAWQFKALRVQITIHRRRKCHSRIKSSASLHKRIFSSLLVGTTASWQRMPWGSISLNLRACNTKNDPLLPAKVPPTSWRSYSLPKQCHPLEIKCSNISHSSHDT